MQGIRQTKTRREIYFRDRVGVFQQKLVFAKINASISSRYICVRHYANFGLDNGLSPDLCQEIIWTNDAILIIGPLGTNCHPGNTLGFQIQVIFRTKDGIAY